MRREDEGRQSDEAGEHHPGEGDEADRHRATETVDPLVHALEFVIDPIELFVYPVETAIDLVPHAARKREINVALSNSFGFGGTNASVILQRVIN